MFETHHKRILSWILALTIMVAALVLSTPQEGHAAVVIKTQDAADRIPGGIRGIDVSKWQGSINWTSVARDDVNFAMIRATLGMEVDDTFYWNATNAHAAGLKVGAYHYAKFTDYSSMLDEVELFIRQLKQVNITYPVVLDVEANRGLSKSELSRLCVLFLDEVKAAGYSGMLYTYENFIDPCFDLSQFSDYKLWVANYKEEPNRNQDMWQHTSYGSVMGISGRVDINIAYEDLTPKRPRTVDADVSRSIKETLNARYNVGLSLDELDMNAIQWATAIGFQVEVNRQFGVDYPIYDFVSEDALNQLASINYVPNQTKGNITYLVQARLFYRGNYEGYPTGQYDDYTTEAIRIYQQEMGLNATGIIDPETVWLLME